MRELSETTAGSIYGLKPRWVQPNRWPRIRSIPMDRYLPNTIMVDFSSTRKQLGCTGRTDTQTPPVFFFNTAFRILPDTPSNGVTWLSSDVLPVRLRSVFSAP